MTVVWSAKLSCFRDEPAGEAGRTLFEPEGRVIFRAERRVALTGEGGRGTVDGSMFASAFSIVSIPMAAIASEMFQFPMLS
jgi:hypothetical protein